MRRATGTISIDRALSDRNLLGAALGSSASWSRWLVVLRAAFGLPIAAEDQAAFVEVAGDRPPPSRRVSELWAVVGRRSGKTRMAAAIAAYIGAVEQHRLAPGEVGCVLLLAASKQQASVAFSYVVSFLESSPVLRQQIESMTAEEIRLRGNIVIGVHAGSYRTIRGRTLLAVVGDETSYWRDETSAQPDLEIFRACAPALSASNGMWIGISTGYRKLGLLYQRWRDHFGQASDETLVVQGASLKFNPLLSPIVIERAKAADPAAAESEWGGGFRNDISAFLDDATIDASIDHGRPLELPPRKDVTYYVGFSDSSGGRHDHFTLAIGHKENDRCICDVITGRAPLFDPQEVVAQYAKLLKDYGITNICGDNYSAAWVETAWSDNGIRYERSEINKSQIYLEALPLFMRGAVSIPDHARLIRELRLLERRASRAGKDVVDHGRSGSDDYPNSLCGMLYEMTAGSSYGWTWEAIGGPPPEDPKDKAAVSHNSYGERSLYEHPALLGANVFGFPFR
jgi:hypothetical protein